MFSSLEVLDAPDALEPIPVARQGVFQPKAKPRARKGGGGSTVPASTSSRKPCEVPAPVSARKTECGNSDPSAAGASQESAASAASAYSKGVADATMDLPQHDKVNLYGGSTINFCAETENDGEAHQTSITTATFELSQSASAAGNDEEAHQTSNTTAMFELFQSALLPADLPINQLESPSEKGGGSSKDAELETLPASPVKGPDDAEAEGENLSNNQSNRVKLKSVAKAQCGVNELEGAAGPAEVSSPKRLDTSLSQAPLVDSPEQQVIECVEEVAEVAVDHPPVKKAVRRKKVSFLEISSQGSTDNRSETSLDLNLKAKFPLPDQRDSSLSETSGAPSPDSQAVEGGISNCGAARKQVSRRKKKPSEIQEQNRGSSSQVSTFSTQASVDPPLSEGKHKKIGRKAVNNVSEDGHEIEGNADGTVIRKRKKRTVTLCSNEQETGLRTGVENSTQSSNVINEAETKQPDADSLGAIEEKKKCRRRSHVQQEGTATDPSKNITDKPSAGTSKPRRKRVATFAAVDSALPQPSAENAANGEHTGEPSVTAQEGPKKKRLMRRTLRNKKAERRAINPADPDLDPKKMTMKDIIRLAEAKEKLSKEGTARRSKEASERKLSSAGAEEEQQQNARVAFTPQVQVIDGRIVINQESLTVSAHPVNDVRNYTRVEETHSKLNYHSYMKKTPKQTWKPDETDLFYKALQEFGTNFALIQHLFPGRTRRQVFLKFKKEERAHPLRLADAMTYKSKGHSQFMEVINLLNLSTDVPDQAQDSLGCHKAPISLGTESSREEPEKASSELALQNSEVTEELPLQLKGVEAEGSEPRTLKEEPLLKEESLKDYKVDDIVTDTNPLVDLGAIGPSSAKAYDSPKKESSPPRTKSLFSYQTFSSKSSKSLFSYQHI